MDDTALKLSDAAKLCGIPARTLKLLIADDLLPQAVRTQNGNALLPLNNVPTWQHCRDLIEERRDRALQRCGKLLDRVEVELEAVRNDIAEARQHPTQPLGVDFTSASAYTAGPRESTLSAVLLQLDLSRGEVERYHRALVEVVEADRG